MARLDAAMRTPHILSAMDHKEEFAVMPIKSLVVNRVSLVLLAGLLSALALTGCNTVDGMGRDIEKAGQKIQSL